MATYYKTAIVFTLKEYVSFKRVKIVVTHVAKDIHICCRNCFYFTFLYMIISYKRHKVHIHVHKSI